MTFTREAIDVVRDLVLAHRAMVRHAGKGDAEAAQGQHAIEISHRLDVALGQIAGALVELDLVGDLDRVGLLEIGGAQQPVRHPPVGLRDRAGETIREAGGGEVGRRGGGHLEVDEEARRRVRGQRHLQAAVEGERCRGGCVAVHRGGGGEHAIAPVVQPRHVFAEVVDRAGADRDDRVIPAQLFRQAADFGHVSVGMIEHDGLDRTEFAQRLGNARAHRPIRRLVGDQSKAMSESQGGDQFGLPSLEAVFDHDGIVRHPYRCTGERIDPAACHQIVDQRGPVVL